MILDGLPAVFPAAVVVVQHLDPRQRAPMTVDAENGQLMSLLEFLKQTGGESCC